MGWTDKFFDMSADPVSLGTTFLGGLVGGPAGALAGFGLGSSISSAQDAVDAGKEANAANIEYAKETNATAIELANTAHQREMADLKAAGLNPILSAKYGGASVPSLQSPKVESLAPTYLSSGKNTQDMLSKGADVSLATQLQKSQVEVNSALAAKTQVEALTTAAKLPAIASASKLEKKAADYRRSRPEPNNKMGWDLTDFAHSITGALTSLFK